MAGLVRIGSCLIVGCRGVLWARRRALTMLCACDAPACPKKHFVVSWAFGDIAAFDAIPRWYQHIAVASSCYARRLLARQEMKEERPAGSALSDLAHTLNRKGGVLAQSEVDALMKAFDEVRGEEDKTPGRSIDAIMNASPSQKRREAMDRVHTATAQMARKPKSAPGEKKEDAEWSTPASNIIPMRRTA